MSKDDLLTLIPMAEYEAPDLPTLSEAKPELLKKMPLRWKNKALIAAASLSLLSAVPLSGCIPGMHHGGASMAPMYVTYLTEQEALEMIRLRLAEVGLNMVEPIDFDTMVISVNGQREHVGINLFNEENRLGIVIISLGERAGHSGHWNTSIRREAIKTELRNEAVDHIHILIVREDHFEDFWYGEEHENQIIMAHERIENRLLEDLEELIEHLQEQGIIE